MLGLLQDGAGRQLTPDTVKQKAQHIARKARERAHVEASTVQDPDASAVETRPPGGHTVAAVTEALCEACFILFFFFAQWCWRRACEGYVVCFSQDI